MNQVSGIVVFTCLLVSRAVGQWEPDVRVTNYPGSGRSITAEPAASVDSFVCVVWDDSRDPSMHETYFKRSTDDGATWQEDLRLTPADAYWSPAAAVAAQDSDVHVVWHELRHIVQNPTNEEIYYLHSTDRGVNWQAEARLTNDTSHSWHPRIAVAGDNLHVVWADYRTGLWQVWYKGSTDNGATWGSDTRLSNGTGIIEVPEVAVARGNVHVVWQDSRHGTNNREVYYARSTDNGATWVPETRLTSEPHESYCPIVSASGGNVHVVWVDYRDLNSEVYYKRSTDNGATWGSDVNLSNNGSNPGLYTTLPSVAASGPNVHVVWADDFDGNDEIYYKVSRNDGVLWADAVRLTDNPAVSASPAVVVSGDGVKVVWLDQRAGPNLELFYKRNPTANSVAVAEPRFAAEWRGLSIAPNPLGRGPAFITMRDGAAGCASVRVIDASGRTALLVSPENGVLDLGSLSSGVYLVRVETGGWSACCKVAVRR